MTTLPDMIKEDFDRLKIPLMMLMEGIASMVAGGTIMYFEAIFIIQQFKIHQGIFTNLMFGLDILLMGYGAMLVFVGVVAYWFPGLQKFLKGFQ